MGFSPSHRGPSHFTTVEACFQDFAQAAMRGAGPKQLEACRASCYVGALYVFDAIMRIRTRVVAGDLTEAQGAVQMAVLQNEIRGHFHLPGAEDET